MLLRFAALAMIALWAAGVFFFSAPGWIHLLLSGGLALFVYGFVAPAPNQK